MKRMVFAALLAAAAVGVQAQQKGYAEQQGREIKSLSDQEVEQYLAGAGIGYAKAAELNHFPGPMHVLELVDQLHLTPTQRGQTKTLMDAHKAEARAIGVRYVDAERALEQLFKKGEIDSEALAAHVIRAAKLQGEYRLSHLETHRRMRALLTEQQVKRYDALRGYGTGQPQQHRH
jgi:Spy/CpxP family protein refolding chaperone